MKAIIVWTTLIGWMAIPVSAQEKTTEPSANADAVRTVAASISVSETTDGQIQPAIGLQTSGFLRVGYGAIFQDSQSPDFVGRNDGFLVESARLNFDVALSEVSGRISIDGAVDEFDSRNTASGRVTVSLLDAYFDYSVGDRLDVRIGQFRPEYDLEAARSRRDMIFIYRALYNRGVRSIEGYNVTGLGLSREVGLAIQGRFGASGGFHGNYQLALSNGENADVSNNDNEQPAVGSRLTFSLGQLLTLGVGGRFNQRTTGDAPDFIEQVELSLTTDVQYRQVIGAYVFTLEGAFSQQKVDVQAVEGEPTTMRRGFHGTCMLGRRNLTFAYRYARFDPTASFSDVSDTQLAEAYDADALTHQTIGVSYRPNDGALTIQANFTIVQEHVNRAYANDRLDLLAQLVF